MKPKCECIFQKKNYLIFIAMLPSSHLPHFEKTQPDLLMSITVQKAEFPFTVNCHCSISHSYSENRVTLSSCIGGNKKLGTQKRVKVAVSSPMPLLSKCAINCDRCKPGSSFNCYLGISKILGGNTFKTSFLQPFNFINNLLFIYDPVFQPL